MAKKKTKKKKAKRNSDIKLIKSVREMCECILGVRVILRSMEVEMERFTEGKEIISNQKVEKPFLTWFDLDMIWNVLSEKLKQPHRKFKKEGLKDLAVLNKKIEMALFENMIHRS